MMLEQIEEYFDFKPSFDWQLSLATKMLLGDFCPNNYLPILS